MVTFEAKHETKHKTKHEAKHEAQVHRGGRQRKACAVAHGEDFSVGHDVDEALIDGQEVGRRCSAARKGGVLERKEALFWARESSGLTQHR